jgi:hypothetical protein
MDRAGELRSFGKDTILAWVVSEVAATPVTIHGLDEHARAILMPDGRVEEYAGCCWQCLDDFTQDMLQLDRRRVARLQVEISAKPEAVRPRSVAHQIHLDSAEETC